MNRSIHVKLLGVRGTVPVHGPEFTQFGGATSCVLVRAGDESLILDAGTGLHGRQFASFCPGKRFSMLISHAHVDHLMGFPIFSPLFDPEVQGDVYLKTRDGHSAREQIESLMAPPLWPIRTNAVKADLRFHDVPESFAIGGVRVDAMESCHPGGSTIYKIACGDVSVVYATDYEPESDVPEDFCEFARDCSLLLLDGQYLTEEYARTKGFGHSTIDRSAAIAAACNAATTLFIHHDPNRTDAQLTELERAVREKNPRIRFGREGEEVVL